MQDNEDLLAIYVAFSSTPHGQQLAHQVRYEKYKPASYSNERWTALLGPDVNNLEHLRVSYDITKDFIRNHGDAADALTAEDQAVLLTAALIHDWAEAVVGDVSFGDRTAEFDEQEIEVFRSKLHEFYTEDNDVHRTLIETARQEVIFDHDSRLGRMFNAVERIGYLQTALRAYRRVASNTAGEAAEGLQWLTTDVLCNQMVILATTYA